MAADKYHVSTVYGCSAYEDANGKLTVKLTSTEYDINSRTGNVKRGAAWGRKTVLAEALTADDVVFLVNQLLASLLPYTLELEAKAFPSVED